MPSWINHLLEALKRLGWAGALGISLALAAASLVLAAVLVLQWPVAKFKSSHAPVFWETRHPVVRIAGLVAKNVAGYLILIVGVIMAFPGVPGQGALLILIGLTLIDFPGKRRLEGKLIRRPAVRRVVNGLRARFGHPALELD